MTSRVFRPGASWVLGGSLVLNLGLWAALCARPAPGPAGSRAQEDGPAPAQSSASPAAAGSSTAAAAATFWSALDTDDLPLLVARLRAAGFSPHDRRAIVAAKVDARFASRREAREDDAPERPFWQAERGRSPRDEKRAAGRSECARARTELLRELLGDDYFADGSGDPVAARRRVFGDLPREKIERVQRIQEDYGEMFARIFAAMRDVTLPEDREQFALLERERQADLAAVLTPEEWENYELRTSSAAARLRPVARAMDATEDEFRALFQVQRRFEPVLHPVPMPGYSTSDSFQQRQQAQRRLTEEIARALGPERFADYQRAADREFQQLRQIAERERVAPEAAVRAYRLREDFAPQSTAILDSGTLDTAQKRAALETLGRAARAQAVATLGEAAGAAYVQSARWIRHLESGGAVAVAADGTVRYRVAPPTPPAGPGN